MTGLKRAGITVAGEIRQEAHVNSSRVSFKTAHIFASPMTDFTSLLQFEMFDTEADLLHCVTSILQHHASVNDIVLHASIMGEVEHASHSKNLVLGN